MSASFVTDRYVCACMRTRVRACVCGSMSVYVVTRRYACVLVGMCVCARVCGIYVGVSRDA